MATAAEALEEETNVNATLELMRLADAQGVRTFVHQGTAAGLRYPDEMMKSVSRRANGLVPEEELISGEGLRLKACSNF